MKAVIITLLVFIVCSSCSVKPEPLAYGKDACHACRMTLVDQRFGAELLTTKGKIYKFDDINCLVSFYKSGFVPKEEIHSVLAVNYEKEGELTDAAKAFYVLSDQVRSPMGGNAAVFMDRSKADMQNETMKGKVLGWNEVLTTY